MGNERGKKNIHQYLGINIFPKKIVITLRDISEVYLSLIEKHRIQGVESRLPPQWSFEYCIEQSSYLVELYQRFPTSLLVDYKDFVENQGTRQRLKDYLNMQGEGVTDLNFSDYGRGYEALLYKGEIKPRPQSYLTI